MTVTTIYLGLGSNRGERMANLEAALAALTPAVRMVRRSTVYETEPWGYVEQARFLNMVVEAETELSPQELLAHIKHIEQQVGRVASFRYGPREIDIDILLYGDFQVDLGEAEARLTIPHPRLAERAFVLVPLAELAPQLAVPGLAATVAELLAAQDASGVMQFTPGAQHEDR
ncbi:MAG: 2-amino-4-hydroxy-6-hydroxymethyldihydropteridine diphosphokinase [Anaerolineales bacterium]|jgi:2-amino-4-hydroxy-6-hydroxymethyldihydropteridine diphosphokinase|nr:2-amino-4-hydroxy-6-hydroxymethyldihydropteridine diphosphokinase [Anaerolineales bacterium]MBX3005793.1 2-amino-4-hydroxy-6-hydroxymethyldihydropteridine diphosphokinase [Anaerolineales bacterium]MCW5887259.1 2-amino-4-hydroxy-6-hydroxymethyldihydropteridine diphosphokinase [Anaerolineales bacterium]